MLYEMVARRRPFPEPTVMELASAILRDSPDPLPPEVPAGLAGIIQRCLIKDPAQRYQRASDVRAALEAIASSTSPAQATGRPAVAPSNSRLVRWSVVSAIGIALVIAGVIVVNRTRSTNVENVSKPASIAVLPFHSLGAPAELGFLEVGIPDAIINRLAGASQVRVRPTNAILRYERQTVSPQEAGKTLAADYILTGTLQPTADRLRVTVQLVRADNETPLWGERYDIDRRDLLTLQDRIAAEVATALQIACRRLSAIASTAGTRERV
jgi:serine/threonine-protein kinase